MSTTRPRAGIAAHVSRSTAVLAAAVLGAAGASIVSGISAPSAHAADVIIGSATAAPNEFLESGDQITVSVSGFPANVMVFGVQCDQRVVTSGDNTYCDTTNVAVVMTDGTGSGSASFTVTAGDDFASANEKGVCNAKKPCEMAFQHAGETDTTVALASIYFGTETTTSVETSRALYKPGQTAYLRIAVTHEGDGVPTGTVIVRDNGRIVKTREITASGNLRVAVPIDKPGPHRLAARYAGDTAFVASGGQVKVTAKPKG